MADGDETVIKFNNYSIELYSTVNGLAAGREGSYPGQIVSRIRMLLESATLLIFGP